MTFQFIYIFWIDSARINYDLYERHIAGCMNPDRIIKTYI